MSDVDSMSAIRIGPRSERNPSVDEVDTILLSDRATVRDNARIAHSFPYASGWRPDLRDGVHDVRSRVTLVSARTSPLCAPRRHGIRAGILRLPRRRRHG